jgi:hypothetical protein
MDYRSSSSTVLAEGWLELEGFFQLLRTDVLVTGSSLEGKGLFFITLEAPH